MVDLFAGGGGLSLGFINAGFDVVAAFDNWTPACELYRLNFHSHPMIQADLSNENTIKKIGKFSPGIIIGGPPCQDFSSAGNRDETRGRASLTVKILDASYCGVPQLRKRVIVVGELNGKNNFILQQLEDHLSKTRLTVKQYLGEEFGVKYYYRHPRCDKRRAVFSANEPSPTIRGVNRPVPSGYPGHPGDAAQIGPEIRPLTTKERSMIQTFPKNFILNGNKTNIEQIIGNAVPVKLAEYIALRLKDYIVIKNKKSTRRNLVLQR